MPVSKKALLEKLLEDRKILEELEDKVSLAKAEKAKSQAQLIDAMDEADEKSVKISTAYGIRNVARTEQLYASVKKDQQEEMLKWIDEECGRPDMIKQSVHSSTLSSFVGQRITAAKPVPAFIEMYFKPGLRISKSK